MDRLETTLDQILAPPSKRSHLSPAPRKLPNPISRLPDENGTATVCEPIFEEICVLANGDVVCSSCDVNGTRVYGNVFRDRVSDIFSGAAYREIREWQLKSRPDSWCPGIDRHCPKRVVQATGSESKDNNKVRTLKLEPTTHCNLKCPACPVVQNFETIPELNQHRAYKNLPETVMLDVVEQLPDLQQILYFNFGEPFLNKGTVSFLRKVRRKRPTIKILTNTNGLALTRTQIDAIATEWLMDHVVFSIDGAFQESYSKYRVGGDLTKALGKLRDFVATCQQAGTRDRIIVIWQYILFDWNDSDAELALANRLATEIGIPIDWVITHDQGASKRFLSAADVHAALAASTDRVPLVSTAVPAALSFELAKKNITDFGLYATIGVSCRINSVGRKRSSYLAKVQNLLGRLFGARAIPPADRFHATFRADTTAISAPAGHQIEITLTFENYSTGAFISMEQLQGSLRAGLKLRHASGKVQEITMPAAMSISDSKFSIRHLFAVPKEAGNYVMHFDVIEELTCWFGDRGSKPLTIQLLVS